MTFATRQTAALENLRTRFGESATFNRYTYGNPDYRAGTAGTATLAETASVSIVRSKTAVALERGAAGGRTGVERFEAWCLAADLAWTPTEDDTRVVFNGVTYRPVVVETENDGLAWRFRFERMRAE